jgi:alanyl-tRNA synthetase
VSGEIQIDSAVQLKVDPEARAATVRNHSGTHLLHAALREVLGPQAMQKGSLVSPDRLRFDFTHDAPLADAEIVAIEDRVNAWIERNAPARIRSLPYREAVESGAVAIFEEKYGDVVRVISFGDFSTELCGGTHAKATGDIGLLKIVGESGIAAGVRRIEALTGLGALEHLRAQERLLRRLAEQLKSPVGELPARVEKLIEERRAAEQEIERLRREKRGAASADLTAGAESIGGARVVATRVDGVDAKELRSMIDELRNKLGSGAVMLAAPGDDRVTLAVGVTPDLAKALHAGQLVTAVSAVVGGKGGGRPDFAQGGGPDTGKVDEALSKFRELVREKLAS